MYYYPSNEPRDRDGKPLMTFPASPGDESRPRIVHHRYGTRYYIGDVEFADVELWKAAILARRHADALAEHDANGA